MEERTHTLVPGKAKCEPLEGGGLGSSAAVRRPVLFILMHFQDAAENSHLLQGVWDWVRPLQSVQQVNQDSIHLFSPPPLNVASTLPLQGLCSSAHSPEWDPLAALGILCRGDHHVHCKVLTTPLVSTHWMLVPSPCSCDNQTCLKTLLHVPWS